MWVGRGVTNDIRPSGYVLMSSCVVVVEVVVVGSLLKRAVRLTGPSLQCADDPADMMTG